MNDLEQLNVQAGHYGKNGQAIIGEVWLKTKMHCIKLLGDKLSARSFDSQVNEIHARVTVLNRFTELGRPLTQVTP